MKNLFIILALLSFSCSGEKGYKSVDGEHENDNKSMAFMSAARSKHLSLGIQIDFTNRQILGVAAHEIDRNGADTVYFDIKDLEISKVYVNDSIDYKKIVETEFEIIKGNEFGDAVAVPINDYTYSIHIAYKTSPESQALQWLAPEQTFNKEKPFLYSQGFSIMSRSWIPLQDSPSIKITYEANVKAPRDVMVVMSCANKGKKSLSGSYDFKQLNPVPPYGIALAAGDISFFPISGSSGIYAESAILEKALNEFEDLDLLLLDLKSHFGAYRWNDLSLLIMPPSFPYGGMENPCLPFISPTVISGDKSQLSLIVHEIAHAWSGNLVTNATWNDFWLNEGITNYLERSVRRDVEGESYFEVVELLAYNKLMTGMEDIAKKDQRLKIEIGERHPDEGVNVVAYEKGYFFLRALEEKLGRETMRSFLRSYFDQYAFQSISTEDFLRLLVNKHGEELKDFPIDEWVYEGGMPSSFKTPFSDRIVSLDELIEKYKKESSFDIEVMNDRSKNEWEYFLKRLLEIEEFEMMQQLDDAYSLSNETNSNVKYLWLQLSIRNNYSAEKEDLLQFLSVVGRSKYTYPLYREMLSSEEYGVEKCRQIYELNKGSYHYSSQRRIEALFDQSL